MNFNLKIFNCYICLFSSGFPKLLVDRYPLDTVAGLHVPPKCCDVSLKQGVPTSLDDFLKLFELVRLSRVNIVPKHGVL